MSQIVDFEFIKGRCRGDLRSLVEQIEKIQAAVEQGDVQAYEDFLMGDAPSLPVTNQLLAIRLLHLQEMKGQPWDVDELEASPSSVLTDREEG